MSQDELSRMSRTGVIKEKGCLAPAPQSDALMDAAERHAGETDKTDRQTRAREADTGPLLSNKACSPKRSRKCSEEVTWENLKEWRMFSYKITSSCSSVSSTSIPAAPGYLLPQWLLHNDPLIFVSVTPCVHGKAAA
ncbi:uncharacterized protein ACNS7B_012870 isoform 1-T1 [Menidia menidia]